MSETKHTQLPLPREVGGHVWLIELPAFDRSVHGQPITIADRQMAFDLVNRYNAGPKVKELVEMILHPPFKSKVLQEEHLLAKARALESALGGKAE